jgi:hypothetical protein
MCRRQVGALALGHGVDIGMSIWVVGPSLSDIGVVAAKGQKIAQD